MNTIAADMADRWKPSQEQIDHAEAFFAGNALAEDTYTVHVLIGKQDGCWTTDVRVTPVSGLFTRDGAYKAALEYAKLATRTTGKPCTAGYARHTRGGKWAVWEV